MSRDVKPIAEYELHAYVDGELDEQRRLEVEAWLTTDSQARAKVHDYRKLQQALHDQFDPILAEHVESYIDTGSESWFGLARVAVVSALMLASGLFGWSLNRADAEPPSPSMSDLVQPAAFAHYVYTTDTLYPVEIAGDEQASLNSWVSRRIHTDLHAPELAVVGLSLVGGRLLPSTNRMAAQFMYEDKRGKRITVYVRRITGKDSFTDFRYREQNGLNVFYWLDNAMGYAVIGEHDASRLIAVASAVQTAFIEQNKHNLSQTEGSKF